MRVLKVNKENTKNILSDLLKEAQITMTSMPEQYRVF